MARYRLSQSKGGRSTSWNYGEIDQSKVYRTVKVVKEDGRGTQIDFSWRIKRFKCKNGCEHHNHLVCVVCGQHSYLDNVPLEDLQDKLAKDRSFMPKQHMFQVFGVCKNCW